MLNAFFTKILGYSKLKKKLSDVKVKKKKDRQTDREKYNKLCKIKLSPENFTSSKPEATIMTQIPSSHSPCHGIESKTYMTLKQTHTSLHLQLCSCSCFPPYRSLTFVKDNSCKSYFHHFFTLTYTKQVFITTSFLSLCLHVHVLSSPQKAQVGYVNTYGTFWEERKKSSIHTTCS